MKLSRRVFLVSAVGGLAVPVPLRLGPSPRHVIWRHRRWASTPGQVERVYCSPLMDVRGLDRAALVEKYSRLQAKWSVEPR